MKRFARVLALLMAVLCMTAVLCACGDGKSDGTDGNDGTVVGSPNSDRRAANSIVAAIAQDLDDSLDPHHMEAAGTREVLFNVFEGLLKPDSEGNLIPAVAEKYVVSDSGDTYTFTLRAGVRFHNGDPVTVGDVLFSLRRCMGENGGEALIDGFEAVQSVEATDDSTVVIHLKEASATFPASLTAAIIPENYDKQDTAPVGTGPFRFVSRSPQENVILERFEDYWGEKAKLSKVEFRIIENSSATVMALKGGSVDFCPHLTSVQTAELGKDFTVLEGTMNLVQAVYLNNDFAPLDNEKVRQAMSYAIDREQIMLYLADGRGTAVGSSMYPAFGKYFMPELAEYYGFDTAKAKALLAEAGYPDGFALEISVPSNYQPHMDTASVVVEQLRAIGIKATIKPVEWSSWLSDVYQGRNYQATIIGFDAKNLTAQAMLARFCSDAPDNISNFADAEYDRVYAEACATVDDAKQTELFKRCEEILTERAANLYIQDLCDLVAIRSDLTGYAFYPLYAMDLSTVEYK